MIDMFFCQSTILIMAGEAISRLRKRKKNTACLAGSKGGGLGGSSASARRGEAVYKLQSPQAEPVNPSSHVKQLRTYLLLSKVINCLPERL